MVLEQGTAFVLTIAVGFLSGFFYDFYRICRRLLGLKRAGIGDFLFCVGLTALVFASLLFINYGEMRFYVILGLALGALIYFQFCSRAVYRTILTFSRFLGRTLISLFNLLKYIWRKITFPFRLVVPAIAGVARPVVFLFKSLRGLKLFKQ